MSPLPISVLMLKQSDKAGIASLSIVGEKGRKIVTH